MRNKILALALLSGLTIGSVGCKPYDTPEYVEIASNETAFMIPLEGQTENQTSFDSEAYLKENLIATKRVRIPHRWNKTGRFWWQGQWMDTVRVITVNRTPVSRYWIDDKGIEVETNDSTALSLDVTITVFITPENAAKFLYMYPFRELDQVVDNEVRAMVQTELTAEVARYSLEQVKFDKNSIMQPVRERVIAFFESRGISISTLGFGGGLNYKNPAIQAAIDKTVQDQQLVLSAEAVYKAQLQENQTILAKAKADADANILRATGNADAIRLMADARAYELQQSALTGANFVSLRQLEIFSEFVNRWNGQLPTYLMGDTVPLINMKP